MVGRVDFKIRGAKELEAALKELGPKLATRGGDKAVRAGAKPIVKQAKMLVPRRTGELRRSITAVKQKSRGGTFAATQTVLIGFKPPASRRAHLTEFGTARSPAKPFMRPALDSTHEEAIDAMRDELASFILRQEWKKALGVMAATGEEIDFGSDEE